MEDILTSKKTNCIELTNFKYLRFYQMKNQNIAVLIDDKGFEIIKGYGSSLVDALNDLHQNLI